MIAEPLGGESGDRRLAIAEFGFAHVGQEIERRIIDMDIDVMIHRQIVRTHDVTVIVLIRQQSVEPQCGDGLIAGDRSKITAGDRLAAGHQDGVVVSD